MSRILDTGQLTKGPELRLFEEESAARLEVSHAVGVSSCTSGLMLCLQALKRRVQGTSKTLVAVPSYTFMASVAAIIWAGFEPYFLEVDQNSMNLCLGDLEEALSEPKLAGVLAVHCFGNPLPSETLENLCGRFRVPIIYDAAHAFGSLENGRPIGGQGWCQVFSLTPTKMVVAGEGGLITTEDSELARELVLAREYGNDGSYGSVFAGMNARMSEFHACLARGSLTLLDEVVAHRNEMACSLNGALSSLSGVSFQQISQDCRSTYKDFTIKIDAGSFGCSRDTLAWALQEEGVPSRAYFSPPCHTHQAYCGYSTRPLPRTDMLSSQCLSIPVLEADTVGPLAVAFSKIQRHASELVRHQREEPTSV